MSKLAINRITITNFCKIRHLDVRLPGGSVKIGGRNGAGKTTVLQAVEILLGGASFAPEQPIRRGEQKAQILGQIGDFNVVREWFPKGDGKIGTEVRLLDRTGAVYPSPKATLEAFLGTAGGLLLDPLKFSECKPAERVDTLRRLLGLDFSGLDEEAAEIREERKLVNAQLRDLQGWTTRLPDLKGAPDEEVATAELLAEAEAIARHNAEIDKAASDIEIGRQHLRVKQDLAKATEDEIARLQEKLEAQKKECAAYARKIEDAEAELARMQRRDDSEIRARLADADSVNEMARLKKQALAEKKNWEDKEAQRVRLNERLDQIAAEKARQIAACAMPVDGLSFGEDDLLYNGVPFSQASSAEKIRISSAIALAMANGQCKVLIVENASLLDEESMEVVRSLAEQAGAQAFFEFVGTPDDMTIVLDEGELVGGTAKEAESA